VLARVRDDGSVAQQTNSCFDWSFTGTGTRQQRYRRRRLIAGRRLLMVAACRQSGKVTGR